MMPIGTMATPRRRVRAKFHTRRKVRSRNDEDRPAHSNHCALNCNHGGTDVVQPVDSGAERQDSRGAVGLSSELASAGYSCRTISACSTRVPETASEKMKSTLLDPSIIVPPLLWLVSPEADGMTGRRLVATKWQAGNDGKSAAEAAIEQAGW